MAVAHIAPIAVIYCRVSTADQSCERQERDLRAFADRAGYQIAGVYIETASGARNDRAERKKVMALAQRREIGTILVTCSCATLSAAMRDFIGDFCSN